MPVFAPAVTWIDPDTNVTPVGNASVSTMAVPVSWPLFGTVIVYCSVSPGSTAPPVWLFRSVTVVVVVEKSGFTVAIDVTKPPTMYESSFVDAVTVALVSPGLTNDVTFSTSRSIPLMLFTSPVVRGRSPAFETRAPRYVCVPL